MAPAKLYAGVKATPGKVAELSKAGYAKGIQAGQSGVTLAKAHPYKTAACLVAVAAVAGTTAYVLNNAKTKSTP